MVMFSLFEFKLRFPIKRLYPLFSVLVQNKVTINASYLNSKFGGTLDKVLFTLHLTLWAM
jgi:hypothetical protein